MTNNTVKKSSCIAIVGAEGVGKTLLTKRLAQKFNALVHSEFGKWYCTTFYQQFYFNQQFQTSALDFCIISALTWLGMHKISESSQDQNKTLCLFDTDLIITDFFAQQQFPNWKGTEYFIARQPIDLWIFICGPPFVQTNYHYFNSRQKVASEQKLLQLYLGKVPAEKLWVIPANDYENRYHQILRRLENYLINEK